MKDIKLISIVIALVLLVVAPLAAADYSPNVATYKQTGEPFMGTSTRVLSMGGAGLGVKGYYDSFLINPANLVGGDFKLSLPAITVTAYNPKDILESGAIEEFEKGTDDGMLSGAQKFLGTIKKGYGDLVTTDASVVLTLGGFGIALETQERIMTYKAGVDLTATNLIAQITTAATVGFGLNFSLVPDAISLDIGVSGKAVYKLYLEKQSASSITDMISDEDADPAEIYLNDVPLAAGYALPLSAGVNLNFPFGLRFSTVARNFNGNYSMEVFPSVNDWAEKVLGSSLTTPNTTTGTDSGTFEIESEWKLDAGLTWAPDIGSLIRPIIAVDVLDVMSLSGLEDDALARGFFSQTRLGASVRLLSFLDVRYGINKGYQSIGVGLDLLIFHLDAAYYQLEYGNDLGDKPIDAVSVRFSLLSR
ncbi:MAG TPA: hypothetical protein DCG32_04490 [Sphaerochaeta sp.]|nr:hypothetical protein [Sphaerochaeta sp.]